MSLLSMSSIVRKSNVISGPALAATRHLADFREASQERSPDSIVAKIPAYASIGTTQLPQDTAAATDALNALTATLNDPQGQKIVGNLKDLWSQLTNFSSDIPTTTAGVKAKADAYDALSAKVTAAEQQTIGYVNTFSAKATTAMKNEKTTASRNLIIALIVSAALSLGLAVYIARRIRGNLTAVGHVIDGLADGDLTRRAHIAAADEIGAMTAALDRACAQLQADFGSVATNAQSLASASERLTAVATTAATGSTQIATSIGTVAASTQPTATVVGEARTAADELSTMSNELATLVQRFRF